MNSSGRQVIRGAGSGALASALLITVLSAYAVSLTIVLDGSPRLDSHLGTLGGLLRAALGGPVSIEVGSGLSTAVFTTTGVAMGMVLVVALIVVLSLPRKPLEAISHSLAFYLLVSGVLFGLLRKWESVSVTAAPGLLIVAAATLVVMARRKWKPVEARRSVFRGGLWAFVLLCALAGAALVSVMFVAGADADRLLLMVWIPFLLPNLGLVGIQAMLGQPIFAEVLPALGVGASAFSGDASAAMSIVAGLPTWLVPVAFVSVAVLVIVWRSLVILSARDVETMATIAAVVVGIGLIVGALSLVSYPIADLVATLEWPQAPDGVTARSLVFGLGAASEPAASLMTGLLAGLASLIVVAGLVRIVRRIVWLAPSEQQRSRRQTVDSQMPMSDSGLVG